MLWRGRPKVRKLARKNDAKRLVAALGYRDHVVDQQGRVYDLGASVRRDAALALASVPDSDTVDFGPELIKSLGDSSSEVRRAAAVALGARHEARAAIALTEAALSWDDPRYAAARAAASEALLELIGPDVIEVVVNCVIEGPFDADRAENVVKDMAERGGEETAGRACAAAAAALSRGGGVAAERASELLVWLGSDSVEPLLGLLSDGGDGRTAAIAALGQIGDLGASQPLVRLLFDDDAAVRRAVAIALGLIADPTTVQSLVAATADPNRMVRNAALEALQRLGPLAVMPNSDHHEEAPESHTRPHDIGIRRAIRSSWFHS
jgi:HEAT repeat protein